MNVSFYIAKRYLFSRSNNNAINFISIIAAVGVIIGSAALFIVLSGFAGLKDFSLEFTTFVDPDLKIEASEGKSITVTQEQLHKLNQIEGVLSYSKIIEERVLLNFDNKNLIATLKGVDANFPKSTIDSILVIGTWFEPETDQIVAGWGVSNNLSFGVFDFGKVIKISVPKLGKGQISSAKSAFNSINATNSGVFQINEDLDNKYVYCNFETAQHLLSYKENQISSIEFQLKNSEDIHVIKQQLLTIFGKTIVVKTEHSLMMLYIKC